MALFGDDTDHMKPLSEVAKDALELPVGERFTLARILLELSETGLDFSSEAELAWEQEIIRRMEAVKSGQTQSKSVDNVFAEIDRRFPS